MSRVSALAINAADHLVSKGRLDAAASILRNYLSTNSPKPEILHRLGRVLLAQGRTAEAVPLLKRALEQFQSEPATETSAEPDAGSAESPSATTNPSDTALLPVDVESS